MAGQTSPMEFTERPLRTARIAALTALLLCLCSLTSRAADIDEIDIKANFANYWSAIADRNYKRASAYIHPMQLSQLRTRVLPVFLQACDSPKPAVRVVADRFFGEVPQEQRARLSGPELSILVHRLIFTALPEVTKLLKVTRPQIIEIDQQGNQATVRYKIIVDSESIEATQTLGKFNGRWYLHFTESPQSVAEKFQRVFH